LIPYFRDTDNDKNLYIIARCNGAGKTTAFRMKLSAELNIPEFINPDRIASISPLQ
jgi:predicted ABC-type ATPase